ncbi:hypothetical protein [Burkholderia multivorans]|nr:hypothetical protein [Burkholderia multivorans]
MKAAERRAAALPRTACVGGIFYALRAGGAVVIADFHEQARAFRLDISG